VRKYNTILFDLDGTLLDSRKSVIQATFETADHFLPGQYSYDEINNRFGETFDQFLHFTHLEQHAEKVHQFYLNKVKKNHDQYVQPFPFVKEGIHILNKNGFLLAVVTNKEKLLTYRGLELSGIDVAFDVVTTINDVKKGKPYPESILKTISKLNVRNEQVLMVGDTTFDVTAAKLANISSALLQYKDIHSWSAQPPTYLFHHFNELIYFLMNQEVRKVVI